MKKCTRCKEEKPLDLTHFPPHNRTKSGFDSWCRICRRSYRNSIGRGKYRSMINDDDLKYIKESTHQCVICGSKEKLVVDHDHKKHKIRGMLCNHCNRGLGLFRDNPELLEYAAQYLYASDDRKEWHQYLKETYS